MASKRLRALTRIRRGTLGHGCGRGGHVLLPLARAAAVSTGLRVLHEARELPVVLSVGGVGVVDLLRREGAHDLVEHALQHRRAQLALQHLVPQWKPAVLLERLACGLGHGLVEAGKAPRGTPASREQQQRDRSERERRDRQGLGVVHPAPVVGICWWRGALSPARGALSADPWPTFTKKKTFPQASVAFLLTYLLPRPVGRRFFYC